MNRENQFRNVRDWKKAKGFVRPHPRLTPPASFHRPRGSEERLTRVLCKTLPVCLKELSLESVQFN